MYAGCRGGGEGERGAVLLGYGLWHTRVDADWRNEWIGQAKPFIRHSAHLDGRQCGAEARRKTARYQPFDQMTVNPCRPRELPGSSHAVGGHGAELSRGEATIRRGWPEPFPPALHSALPATRRSPLSSQHLAMRRHPQDHSIPTTRLTHWACMQDDP